MKNKNKKGSSKVLGTVITFILLIAFFLLVAVIFFGDGLLNQAFDKVKNLLKERPEVDQSEDEQDFFRRNDAQLKVLGSWQSSIKTAFEGTASAGGCIMNLQSIDQEGFYAKDANYNLYMDQDGADIVFRLTSYAIQGVGSDAQKVETPVTTIKLPGTQLCIIKDTTNVNGAASEFYKEFNDINAQETPDMTKINPVPVNSLLISSGKSGDTERQIGFKLNGAQDYEWAEFFKKKDNTIIYALRLDTNGVKYLCFFPLRKDVLSKCGGPGNGLLDLDCFDSDAGKRSIKYNIDNGLIPVYYVCKSP